MRVMAVIVKSRISRYLALFEENKQICGSQVRHAISTANNHALATRNSEKKDFAEPFEVERFCSAQLHPNSFVTAQAATTV